MPGFTGLYLAAYFDLEDVAQLLLVSNHTDRKDNNGWTPLSWAAEWGHKAVAMQLLIYGADTGERSSSGMTPLGLAVEFGHVGLIELLLNNGADIEAKDQRGLTPLGLAIGPVILKQ
ncbi:ankyrin repeat protein [Dactylonectria estremocensis]|uniref:Ankyrin repeat protein n=1 Tax=Dactylonectria estremocensis TaxID=1079267 RepID=A0A9P9J5Q3_9HYPO|nr:ankyrin repeat protein [Dactylonectria estremocensis]